MCVYVGGASAAGSGLQLGGQSSSGLQLGGQSSSGLQLGGQLKTGLTTTIQLGLPGQVQASTTGGLQLAQPGQTSTVGGLQLVQPGQTSVASGLQLGQKAGVLQLGSAATPQASTVTTATTQLPGLQLPKPSAQTSVSGAAVPGLTGKLPLPGLGTTISGKFSE